MPPVYKERASPELNGGGAGFNLPAQRGAEYSFPLLALAVHSIQGSRCLCCWGWFGACEWYPSSV